MASDVPEAGLERVARAYARIIDEVNKLSRAEVCAGADPVVKLAVEVRRTASFSVSDLTRPPRWHMEIFAPSAREVSRAAFSNTGR